MLLAIEKEKAVRIASIINNKYYQENIAYLKELFVHSRSHEHRSSPGSILRIQLEIAKFQSAMWKVLREGRQLAKDIRDSKDQKQLKTLPGVEDHILIHEQLIRVSKSIMDGIAWRNMNYDRMLFDVSSKAFGTGAIDINAPDFQSELKWALIMTQELKSTVILNDLTNFLRVGDLTEIKDGVVLVHEIKKLGKKVNNMFTLQDKEKLTKQSKRLLEFQKFSLSKTIEIDGQKVSHVPIHVNIRHHLRRISWLIDEAKQKGYAETTIEPFLKVKVTDFSNPDKFKDLPEQERDPSKNIMPHSNWDAFYSDEQGNFMRSMLPYSIYPFKNNICMELMSGSLFMVSEFDIDGLWRAFQYKGWGIEPLKEEELDRSLAEYESAKDTLFSGEKLLPSHASAVHFFELRRGPFAFPVDPILGLKMYNEFLSFESVNELAENAYRRAAKIRRPEMYYPVLLGDTKIWN